MPRARRIDVEPGPNRVLKIEFEVVNPFQNPLTGMHIWTSVRAQDSNVLVAEGDFAKRKMGFDLGVDVRLCSRGLFEGRRNSVGASGNRVPTHEGYEHPP